MEILIAVKRYFWLPFMGIEGDKPEIPFIRADKRINIKNIITNILNNN